MKKKILLFILSVAVCLFSGYGFEVFAEYSAFSESAMHEARQVQARHEDYLMNREGVQGVGIGQRNGKLTIVVMVEKQSDSLQIPESVDGMPVIVQEVGKIVAHKMNLGVSVGNDIICDYYCNAGTVGFKVCDKTASGVGGWVTNNHVAASGCPGLCPNNAPLGTNIFSPGIGDNTPPCTTTGAANVGTLKRFVPLILDGVTPNKVDAAFVQSDDDHVSDYIQGLGTQKNEIADPFVGQGVCKSGRTTGVTCGIIGAVNATIDVNENEGCGTARHIGVVEYAPTQPYNTMSEAGDSGSPVVDSTNKAVALNFAGAGNGVGFGIPIRAVLQELQVSLCSDITPTYYSLNVNVSPDDGGLVSGSGITCPGTCSVSFTSGSQASLTTSENAGYIFAGWSGCDSLSGDVCNVTMSSNKTVTAFFTKPLPDLTGSWMSCNPTCKNTKKGVKCSLKGRLNIQNIGLKDAPSSRIRYYLSDNDTYGEGASFLKQDTTWKIKRGKSNSKTLSYSFPYGASIGGKYVIAVLDASNAVEEMDKGNNNVICGPLPGGP